MILISSETIEGIVLIGILITIHLIISIVTLIKGKHRKKYDDKTN